MIPQSQISKLCNRLLKEQGGRRIPESVLERDYCIAWFLVGLSENSLKKNLLFKGGTALRRCYFLDYRFSEDLDFTLMHPLPFESIKEELEDVYAKVKQASNITFSFSREDTNRHRNSHTFYLTYIGPLTSTFKTKEIKVDITINEHIFYSPREVFILKGCEEFNDLPETKTILAYSIEEIISEKTIALLDRARTEPRDLYDLWYILEQGETAIDDCLDAICAKLAHRNKKLKEVRGEFINKERRLKLTWDKRLSAQISTLPEFDHVFRTVKRAFRQAEL